VEILKITDQDREWARKFTVEQWNGEIIISHGETFYPHKLAGFYAVDGDDRIGLITYYTADNACEIVSLNSLRQNSGVGTALIKAVEQVARENNCKRLWLVTSNDNLNALRFYQKYGFELVRIYRHAITEARKTKPIPLIGDYGIPIRDDVELELPL
jgi:ribosomal protein S18 acetylase RimI-like enzyme